MTTRHKNAKSIDGHVKNITNEMRGPGYFGRSGLSTHCLIDTFSQLLNINIIDLKATAKSKVCWYYSERYNAKTFNSSMTISVSTAAASGLIKLGRRTTTSTPHDSVGFQFKPSTCRIPVPRRYLKGLFLL